LAKQPGKKTTAMTKWDAKLAEMAAKAAANEVTSGGNVIGTQGGRLRYKGADIPENKMRVVIIDKIFANLYYEGVFDPSSPASPACYAYGREEEGMAPHDDSPNKQGEDCASCSQNEWGSADRGKGKACKNTRRLAVLAESDLGEDILQAEEAYVHVPVTSVKAWAGYVRQLESTLHRPPLAVVTEIALVPDDDVQFRMTFKTVEQIDDGDVLEALTQKAEAVSKVIEFPYVQITPAEKPARGNRRSAPPPARGRQAAPAAKKKPAKFA